MSHAWPNASSGCRPSTTMRWRMGSRPCWPGAPKAPCAHGPHGFPPIPSNSSSPLDSEKMGKVLIQGLVDKLLWLSLSQYRTFQECLDQGVMLFSASDGALEVGGVSGG